MLVQPHTIEMLLKRSSRSSLIDQRYFKSCQVVVLEIAYRLSFIFENIMGAKAFIDPNKEANTDKMWMIELTY